MPGKRVPVLVCASVMAAIGSAATGEAAVDVHLEVVASGFSFPVQVTHANDGSDRLFVVEQTGRIRVIDDGTVLSTPFLDVSTLIIAEGERGLLGLAFHPDYASNGLLYINYTNVSGHTEVNRYTVSSDPNVADASSRTNLLTIAQPFANHNGGQLFFGPLDGYLYIGMGDGGSGNDPLGHGQNRNTLLGAMLRIDVDGGFPYAIPPSNPYVGVAGADEIWAIGLRNPWRFSFDRETGDLYIGDVGQGTWEEVSYQAGGTPGGVNFGWAIREGPCPRGQTLPCPGPTAGLRDPIAFYGRGSGRSITGGFVYRGVRSPDLHGYYFFADFVSGRLWTVRKIASDPDQWTPIELVMATGFHVSSFGEDEDGELYVVDYGGRILRLRENNPPPTFSSTTMPDGFLGVSYSEMVPVQGGTDPLTFELVGGSPPSGLVGPAPSTGFVSGTPGAIGTGVFDVRVTDDEGRFAVGTLSLEIRLASPTPVSPADGSVTSDTTPELSWTAPPVGGPFTYELLVEDAGGAVVANEIGLADTSFTPASALPDGDLSWRVRATGDGSHVSPFSTPFVFELDSTPPGSAELSGSVPPGFTPIGGTTPISVSGELPGFNKENVVSNPATFWSTPGRSAPVTEQITIDMGGETSIDAVRLTSRADLGSLFPKDFKVQVSNDNTTWTTVHTEAGFSAAAGTAYIFPFASVSARYLRIEITASNPYGSLFYTQLALIEPLRANPVFGTIIVSWNAPFEDGSSGGAATEYALRFQPGDAAGFDFDTATPVGGLPVPGAPGALQSATVSGLVHEATYTFGLRSRDNANNDSVVSLGTFDTLGRAPESIGDLAAAINGLDAIDLGWTVPHEDGDTGPAVSGYTIYFATFPLDAGNLDDAETFPNGLNPRLAGKTPGVDTEALTVTGLLPNTTYYFVVTSFDDKLNTSLPSNLATTDTADAIPPEAISDLEASSGDAKTAHSPVTATSVTSALAAFPKENTTDGDPTTFWSTTGHPSPQTVVLTWDLGTVEEIVQVSLMSRQDTAALFPRDFDIRLSSDGVTFPIVSTISSFSAAAGTWHAFPVPATSARFVRIAAQTVPYGNLHYTQLAEIEVFRSAFAPGAITLQWTAPHEDDGVETSGAATSYHVAYSPDPIDDLAEFEAATKVTDGVPAPAAPGTLETMNVTGFGPEEVNYFMVLAEDGSGNLSAVLPPGVKAATQGIDPGTPASLEVTGATGTTLDVQWVHPGDDADAPGTANVTYDVRYSKNPIDDLSDFQAATIASGPYPSGAPGTLASFTITGLENQTSYSVAVQAIDDADNRSMLSDVVVGTTMDAIAPGRVTDLTATLVSNLSQIATTSATASSSIAGFGPQNVRDGNGASFWSSLGSPSNHSAWIQVDAAVVLASLARVTLRARADVGTLFPKSFEIRASTDGTTWTTVHSETGFTAAPGASYDFDFAETPARFVRIQSTELNRYGVNLYFQLAEIELFEKLDGAARIRLQWTAPGDDEHVQETSADAYDIRLSTLGPIDDANFDAATPLASVPPPSVQGTIESFVVDAPGETGVHFALRAADEVPANVSPVSNSVVVVTPGIPPGIVTDLSAAPLGDGTSVQVTWTAVADDGTTGSPADTHILRWSTSPITTMTEFDAANDVPLGAPAAPGVMEDETVGSLPADTEIHFALVVEDELDNRSDIATASAHTVDLVAPTPITDFAAATGGTVLQPSAISAAIASSALNGFGTANVHDGAASTFWSTTGQPLNGTASITVDLGAPRVVGKVDLLSRADFGGLFPRSFRIQASTDNVSYATLQTVTDFVAAAGTSYSFDGFAPTNTRHLRIQIDVMHPYGALAYAQLAEIEVFESVEAGVSLSWTATGDNGGSGTADRYEIKYDTSPLDAANFGTNGTSVEAPDPAPSGAPETQSVVLPAGTYFFGLRVCDEADLCAFANFPPSVTVP